MGRSKEGESANKVGATFKLSAPKILTSEF